MDKFNNIISNILKIDVNLIHWTFDKDANCYNYININGSIINIKYLYTVDEHILIIYCILKYKYYPDNCIEITYYNGDCRCINLDISNNYYLENNHKYYGNNTYYKYINKDTYIIYLYYELFTYKLYKKICINIMQYNIAYIYKNKYKI